jgi:hypothetical protein
LKIYTFVEIHKERILSEYKNNFKCLIVSLLFA